MHFSVMAAESLELLAVRPDGIYLDATTGLGGHTALIAARLERGFVIANDRDAQSLEMARQNTLELAGNPDPGFLFAFLRLLALVTDQFDFLTAGAPAVAVVRLVVDDDDADRKSVV